MIIQNIHVGNFSAVSLSPEPVRRPSPDLSKSTNAESDKVIYFFNLTLPTYFV